MAEPLGKLKTALSNLIIDSPFFASLALRLELIESLQYETLATDGVSLHYNPDFVNSLTRPEAIGVLAHEASHCAFRHHTRRGERDPQKWNIAADYAINGILIDCDFTLPKGVLIDSKWKGKDAEFIYSQLPDNPEGGGSQKEANGDSGGGGASQTAPKQSKSQGSSPNKQGKQSGGAPDPNGKPQGGDPGRCGQILDAPKGQQAEQEASWKVATAQAHQAAKIQGKLPAGLSRILEMAEPKIPWRQVLAQFITEITRSDYSFDSPNPRYVYHGIYLPRLHSSAVGKLVIGVDTSGSIGDKELNIFLSEVAAVLNDVNPQELVLISCDSKVEEVITLDSSDLEPITGLKGGGGTDYCPVFEEVERDGDLPVALIYLTDGYCNSFPTSEPDYPVLWVLTEDCKSFKPPFGTQIQMEDF